MSRFFLIHFTHAVEISVFSVIASHNGDNSHDSGKYWVQGIVYPSSILTQSYLLNLYMTKVED